VGKLGIYRRVILQINVKRNWLMLHYVNRRVLDEGQVMGFVVAIARNLWAIYRWKASF